MAGIVCLGIASGVFEPTFNNYLNDTFDIGADARGFLEFPRELPGFLTALFAGLLFFMSETLIAALCCLAVGAGMVGLALCGANWNLMMALMILWSLGTHLMMPIRSSIGMHLSHKRRKGTRLGQIAGANLAAALIGSGFVVLSLKYLHATYTATFMFGGIAALIGGVVFLFMRLPEAHLKRPKFVWHPSYWLFYTLALLFGARKQIFITFGPWVLVRVFDQPAYVIAQLWIAAAILGVVIQPLLGRAIDHFGERRVLVIDSLLVLAVCAGYGLSHRIESRQLALWLLYVCYVADHLLFGVNMARTTYLSKIVVKKEHISPTLSLGISINHAVSMSLPAVGGLVWIKFGHPAVFLFAGGVALLMLLFSSFVQTRQTA